MKKFEDIIVIPDFGTVDFEKSQKNLDIALDNEKSELIKSIKKMDNPMFDGESKYGFEESRKQIVNLIKEK